MITLLHGDEEFTRSQALKELRQRVLRDPGLGDLNLAVLDGPVDLGRLQDHSDALPFLGGTRLIIVHGWLGQLAGDLARGSTAAQEKAQALAAYLSHVPESTHLVFVEETTLSDNHPVVRAIEALAEQGKAEVRLFTLPRKARERREYVQRWLRDRARALDVNLDPQATRLLTDVLGHDLRLLDQELNKLRTYAGPGGYVTREDVEQLVPYTQEASIFDMINAIGEGNARQAVLLLQRALEGGQHPLQVLALLARQYRIYIGLKEMAERGVPPDQMASPLRIPPWTVRRDLRVAQRLSWPFLERVMERLLETDVRIKQGKIDPVLAIQLLVLGLSTARGR